MNTMWLNLSQYEGSEEPVSATISSSVISDDWRVNHMQARRIARALFPRDRLGRAVPHWLSPEDFADKSRVMVLQSKTRTVDSSDLSIPLTAESAIYYRS